VALENGIAGDSHPTDVLELRHGRASAHADPFSFNNPRALPGCNGFGAVWSTTNRSSCPTREESGAGCGSWTKPRYEAGVASCASRAAKESTRCTWRT